MKHLFHKSANLFGMILGGDLKHTIICTSVALKKLEILSRLCLKFLTF